MALPGRKPKPYMQIVREGNPGHRPLKRGAVLSGDLAEPDWREFFPASADPAVQGENVRARHVARDAWRKLAPALARSAGLSGEQAAVLAEYCTCLARIDQGERALSRDGVLVTGFAGSKVRNPWATVLNQYRAHFRSLTGELGLSPAAATRISAAPDLDDDDNPFA